MIIQATNFIEESEIQETLEKHGFEFQYLTPKNTVSTFFVTGSFNLKKLNRLTPEKFINTHQDLIYDFDGKWKKIIETESMRDAKKYQNDTIKTDNSQVIANLQEQLKDIEHYVSDGWRDDFVPSDKKVLSGFELALKEISTKFFISGEVMEIVSKHEITPRLIEELKHFIK
jgi:hypothetical protein